LKWFEDNYEYLKNQEINRKNYNHDVFVDTFFRMYDNILYNVNITNFKGYFSRAYYTNTYQQNVIEYRSKSLTIGIELNEAEQVDKTQIETETKINKQTETDAFINQIFEYVKEHYSIQEFSLWRMYIILKPQTSYQRLSIITHIPIQQVSSIISRIKMDINSNPQLKERRKKLLSL
jgi:hypothetical protein